MWLDSRLSPSPPFASSRASPNVSIQPSKTSGGGGCASLILAELAPVASYQERVLAVADFESILHRLQDLEDPLVVVDVGADGLPQQGLDVLDEGELLLSFGSSHLPWTPSSLRNRTRRGRRVPRPKAIASGAP